MACENMAIVEEQRPEKRYRYILSSTAAPKEHPPSGSYPGRRLPKGILGVNKESCNVLVIYVRELLREKRELEWFLAKSDICKC